MSDTYLPCFKAYDIRGRLPEELNDSMAEKVGRAYAAEIGPAGPVVVGYDVRLSSPDMAAALVRGLNSAGVDTREIGLCGTEMVYFAAAQPGMGGGIMVTASHNPADYNGMKLVREEAIPISADSGLMAIERRVRLDDLGTSSGGGRTERQEVLEGFAEKVLQFIEHYRLTGKGLGYVDVHLLASAVLTGVPLWTLDKKLQQASAKLRINYKL